MGCELLVVCALIVALYVPFLWWVTAEPSREETSLALTVWRKL